MHMAAVDTEDLEALFDQIVAEKVTPAPTPAPPAVASANAVPIRVNVDAANASGEEEGDLYHRVGRLTRTLHDTLHELGYDKTLEASVISLPDARDRLAYIAKLTGQAAERSLGAVEQGQAVQQEIGKEAGALVGQWDRLYAKDLSVEEFKALAGQTREFLNGLPKRTTDTYQQLHEIMMAQDFHDLTGQVIGKIVNLARTMEDQLVGLLVESSSISEKKPEEGFLNGPTVNGKDRTDVVTGQAQVDDLLESLGF
jgi:chemotaxis protein CheZ